MAIALWANSISPKRQTLPDESNKHQHNGHTRSRKMLTHHVQRVGMGTVNPSSERRGGDYKAKSFELRSKVSQLKVQSIACDDERVNNINCLKGLGSLLDALLKDQNT